jgi:hypothetical protein
LANVSSVSSRSPGLLVTLEGLWLVCLGMYFDRYPAKIVETVRVLSLWKERQIYLICDCDSDYHQIRFA